MTTRKRWIWIIGAAAVAAVLAGGVWLLRVPGQRASPGIIIISVDTLRPDHLGCYGYRRATSPNVDGFARDGLVYANCFAQAPTTRPSCASFLSGFFPHECRIYGNVDNLPPEVPMLAERLKAAGYRTFAVSSNFVLGVGTGYDRGFEVFDNNLNDEELVRQVPERIAAKTTDAAIGLLRNRGAGKFFLWVHYQDPHGPYTPPAPFDTRFGGSAGTGTRLAFTGSESGIGGIPTYQQLGDHNEYDYYVARYDGEIAYFDVHFGRLLQAIKDLGAYDGSLVILTADHGEGMGERGYYFAHGEFVFNNLVHVPLVVKAPGAGRGTRTEFAQLLDLAPTVMAFAGLDRDSRLRGRNLAGASLPPVPIFSEMGDKFAVVQDGLKLIYHGVEKEFLLFDLTNDPNEERNLATDPRYALLGKPLAATLEQLGTEDLIGATRAPAEVSDEDRRKLKALGYVH